MLFEDVDGVAVAVMPAEGAGHGVRYMGLVEAEKRFGVPKEVLADLWDSNARRFAVDVVDEFDAGEGGSRPEAGKVAENASGAGGRDSGGVGGSSPREKAALQQLRLAKYPALTDEQWEYFLEVCRQRRLNPWARQLLAALEPAERKRDGDEKGGGFELALIMSIEGMRLVAHRTGLYAGIDEIEFGWGEDPRYPASAKATVYRLVGAPGARERASFVARAYWAEYAPAIVEGTLWERMPRVCMERPAEAMALRRAFPAELGGIYVAEEGLGGRQTADDGSRDRARRVVAAGEDDQMVSAESGDVMPAGEDGPQTRRQCELELLELGVTPAAAREAVIARFAAAYPHLVGTPGLYGLVVREVRKRPGDYRGVVGATGPR